MELQRAALHEMLKRKGQTDFSHVRYKETKQSNRLNQSKANPYSESSDEFGRQGK